MNIEAIVLLCADFFFPISSKRHYYLVCFSLKTGVADVLDHVVPENGIPDRVKYGRDLDLLRDYLGLYLKSKGLDELSDFIIKERSTRLLDLPWKTTETRFFCILLSPWCGVIVNGSSRSVKLIKPA